MTASIPISDAIIILFESFNRTVLFRNFRLIDHSEKLDIVDSITHLFLNHDLILLHSMHHHDCTYLACAFTLIHLVYDILCNLSLILHLHSRNWIPTKVKISKYKMFVRRERINFTNHILQLRFWLGGFGGQLWSFRVFQTSYACFIFSETCGQNMTKLFVNFSWLRRKHSNWKV